MVIDASKCRRCVADKMGRWRDGNIQRTIGRRVDENRIRLDGVNTTLELGEASPVTLQRFSGLD